MPMKALEYIRGISADDCRRLRARGIDQTNRLMHVVTLDIDRRRLSAKTGISTDRLLEFGRQCALLEISGLERYLAVVRRLGIGGLKELKRQDPADLHRRVVEAVGYNGAPTLADVQYWVSQARSIDVLEEPQGEPAQVSSPSVRPAPAP
jgi:uncharacterized protein DUF4332